MKKIISLVLVIAMLLSVSAIAEGGSVIEDITFFGNIHFGNTIDDVMTMRKNGGYKAPPQYHFPTYCDMSHAYDSCDIKAYGVSGVEIAGLKNSSVLFAFNENDTIYQCLYTFGVYEFDGESTTTHAPLKNKDEADSIYNALQKMLEQKYGIPSSQYFTEETVHVLYSFADELNVPFTNCAEMANATEQDIFQNWGCLDICEWLVILEGGDGVLIDCFVSYNQIGIDGNRSYTPHILYTFIPSNALIPQENTNDWL